jgi:hypothetical protein
MGSEGPDLPTARHGNVPSATRKRLVRMPDL